MKKKQSRKAISSSKPVSPGPRQPWWNNDWIFLLALAVITVLAYHPAWNGRPIWDDENHLTPAILKSPGGLAAIWTHPGATPQYYPLIYSFFWMERWLWGDAPLGYHLVSILLHLVSAFLLLRVLRLLQVPGAWLAVTLFTLHPVQVESVAWMSELKNTLSGVFFLAAALLYLTFVFHPRRRRILYLLALAAFLLGLFSKTVIAVLPAALLVVLWWKRGKLSWKRDVVPLLPFFASGLSFGLLTAWMEKTFVGASGAEFDFSLIERCLIAGRAIWFYLGKLAWPRTLIFIYPRWEIDQSVWWQYLFPAAALGLLVGLWWNRKKSRGPLAALLLFSGMLFPALGFLDVYPFRYSFVADHFQYLACIAPIALASAGAAAIGSGMKTPALRFWRLLAAVGLTVTLVILTWLTWQQSGMYSDIETLWQTTIDRNPDCWMAYGNFGLVLLLEGKVEPAIDHLKESLTIKDDNAEAHTSLGLALRQKGLIDEALIHFQKAQQIKPDYAASYNDIGTVLQQKGELDGAIAQFQKAVALKPDYGDAHFNLGIALLNRNQADPAIAHFQSALQIDPRDAEARFQLGLALQQKGRDAESVSQFQQALALKPDIAQVHSNFGMTLLQQGHASEAISQLQAVAALEPDNAEPLRNLALALAVDPQSTPVEAERAVVLAQRSIQLDGAENSTSLHTLAAAYAAAGRFREASDTAQHALQLAEREFNEALTVTLKKEIVLYRNHKALR